METRENGKRIDEWKSGWMSAVTSTDFCDVQALAFHSSKHKLSRRLTTAIYFNNPSGCYSI